MPSKGRADIAQASDPVPVIYTTFSKLPLDRNNGCAEGQRCSSNILHLDPPTAASVALFTAALRYSLPLESGPRDERQVSEKSCECNNCAASSSHRSGKRRCSGTLRLLKSNFLISRSNEQLSPVWCLHCLLWREHSPLPFPQGILIVSVSSSCHLQSPLGASEL